MKVTIEKAALARALARAARTATGNSTIPILGCVLIQTAGDGVEVVGTDMDRMVCERVPATVERSGAAAVPARTISDLIKRCPDGSQVELEMPPSTAVQLFGKAGRARWKLDCLPAEDFVRFSPPKGEAVTLEMQAKDLRLVLGEPVMAASTEETRYYLCGVHLRHVALPGRPVLRGEATDGHRMVRFDMPAPAGASALPDVIVPTASVEAIVKLLDGADTAVLTVTEARLSVVAGNVTFTTKLIEATFPDCDRVIPGANDKVIEVEPAALIAAVERVATVAIDKTRSIKLECSAEGIELFAMGGGVGEVRESVDVSRGAAVTIGFNHRYLLDILGRIGGGTARIALSDRASPALITDPDADHALFVVMPVQI